MQFSTGQCAFMLTEYLNSRSYERVRTVFSNEYLNSPLLPKSTISRGAQKFLITGSVLDKPKEHVCTVRTLANAQHVQDSVLNNPHLLNWMTFTCTQHLSHIVATNFTPIKNAPILVFDRSRAETTRPCTTGHLLS